MQEMEKEKNEQAQSNSYQLQSFNQANAKIVLSDNNLIHYYRLKLGCIKPSKNQCQKSILIEEIQIHTKNEILGQQERQIIWVEQFTNKLKITTVQSDMESMIVLAHLGHYQKKISAVITDIDPELLENNFLTNGTFGSIYQFQMNSQKYVLKSVKTSIDFQMNIGAVYEQYFMSCLADFLRVGPKVISTVFGYDIVVLKNRSCFVMEKCQPVSLKSEIMQRQLLENLRKIHSIGFIHFDIKPENVMYSQFYEKFVFIDFGFSKLISQPFGNKTKTHFIGTYIYSSSQMRKIAVLDIEDEVDLYYNDLICLEKTLCEFEKISLNSSDFRSLSSNEKKNSIFFQSISQILSLKYALLMQNTQKVVQICNNGVNRKSLYELASNIHISQKIQQNCEFRSAIKSLRSSIMENKLQSCCLDDYFYNFIKSNDRAQLTPPYLSLAHLLEQPADKFKKHLKSGTLLQNLFSILNPFSCFFSEKDNQNCQQQVYKIRKKIVEKVYSSVSQEANEGQFFFVKTRACLIYLYLSLKELQNILIFRGFRLLFILIEDLGFLKKVEEDLLDKIDDPILKILTFLEISLYYDNLFRQFFYQRSKIFLDKIQKMQGEGEEFQNVKSFAISLLSKDRILSSENEFIQTKNMILLIEKRFFSYAEVIFIIKSLFFQLNKVYLQEEDQKSINTMGMNLTLEIYSVAQNIAIPQDRISAKFQGLFRIFYPLRVEKINKTKTSVYKNKLVRLIQISGQLENETTLTQLLFLNDVFIINEMMSYLISHMRQLIKKNIKKQWKQTSVFREILVIYYFFHIHENAFLLSKDSDKTKAKLELDKLYELLQYAAQQHSNFMVENWFSLFFNCIQSHYLLIKRSQRSSLIQALRRELLPANLDDDNVYHFLMKLVSSKYLKNERCSIQYKNWIVRIAQLYIQKNRFQKLSDPFEFVFALIKIYNQKDFTKNLKFLNQMIDHGNRTFTCHQYNQMLYAYINFFCLSIVEEQRKFVYRQLKLRQNKGLTKWRVFFQLRFFYSILDCLTLTQTQQETRRLCYGLSSIHYEERRMAETFIYQAWRRKKLCEKRRKKLLMLKRECNFVMLEKKIKRMTKILDFVRLKIIERVRKQKKLMQKSQKSDNNEFYRVFLNIKIQLNEKSGINLREA